MFTLAPEWNKKLKPYLSRPAFKKLLQFLNQEKNSGKIIYPEEKNIFRALQDLDLPDVKVVILGQDPYHQPKQAIGYSFAVQNSLMPKPPSLKNIFKELEDDLNIEIDQKQSDLTGWAKQGVLLLNTVMTVEANQPFSHRNQGWEEFTQEVIRHLNERSKPLVFILWGAHAQKLKSQIHLDRHAVFESPHPSPLSSYRGFFGSKIFSKTNEQLKKFQFTPIEWQKISIS